MSEAEFVEEKKRVELGMADAEAGRTVPYAQVREKVVIQFNRKIEVNN